MPKIKWVGNKPWDTDFPEYPMPAYATLINRPDNIFKACLPYGILPLLLSYAVVFVKKTLTIQAELRFTREITY